MATARAAVFRAGKTSKKGKRPNVAAINVVKRGKVSQVSAPIFLGGSSRPNSDLEQTPVEMQDSEQLDPGTPCTTHASRKLKMYERWERLRDSVLHAVVEGKTIAPNSTCCCCHYAAAEVRCTQCGPTVLLCQGCTISLHTFGRFSHTPEIWKVLCLFLAVAN